MNTAPFSWSDYLKPTAQPEPPKRQYLTTVLSLIVCVVALGWLWDRGFFDRFGFDEQRRSEPIEPPPGPDDQRAEPDPVNLHGTFIVAITESKTRTPAQLEVLNDWSFWNEQLPQLGVKWYLRDPDSPDAKSFIDAAKDQGISPPFVMHCRGDQPLWMIPFPKSTEAIQKLLNAAK